jgi:hypothetical protein
MSFVDSVAKEQHITAVTKACEAIISEKSPIWMPNKCAITTLCPQRDLIIIATELLQQLPVEDTFASWVVNIIIHPDVLDELSETADLEQVADTTQHVLAIYKESPTDYRLYIDYVKDNTVMILKDVIDLINDITIDHLSISHTRHDVNDTQTLTIYRQKAIPNALPCYKPFLWESDIIKYQDETSYCLWGCEVNPSRFTSSRIRLCYSYSGYLMSKVAIVNGKKHGVEERYFVIPVNNTLDKNNMKSTSGCSRAWINDVLVTKEIYIRHLLNEYRIIKDLIQIIMLYVVL